MDIRDLKRECNDLIDELETLQQTDAKLDLRIQELQNCLEKTSIPESVTDLPRLPHIVKMEDEETEGIISETVVVEKVIEEKEEVSQNEPSEPLENLREKKEEENPWKEMDQQRFPADTVIIYESSNLENTIVRVIKIIAFCGILCGIMVSVITLAMGM
ncbi:MAG: hypothetical protein ACLUTY_03575 [Waltera sp.]|jgi:hypothetical protein